MSVPRLSPALVCLALYCSSPLPATGATAALSTYEALRGATVDGRTVAAAELVLERDVFEMRFVSGRFHLLRPVDGVTPGAVFVGQGRYRVSPRSTVERRRLWVLSGSSGDGSFSDEFSSAVLLFGDGTEADIVGSGSIETGSPDSKAVEILAANPSDHRSSVELDPELRILRSRLNDEGLPGGPFFAFLSGKTLPRATIAIDPAGILDGEGACLMSETAAGVGFWFSDRLAAAKAGARPQLVDAENYRIDTRVTAGDRLEGETRIKFRVLVPSLQVLPIELFPTLEIQQASLRGSDGVVSVLQPEADRTAAILLPQPLAKDTRAELKIVYSGSGILEEDGPKVYQVKGRTNWYPNLGAFSDRATYDLRFRVPKGNTVISVGERVSTKEEGVEIVSIWKSSEPLTVAGFNYGDFELFEQLEKNTGVAIEVYATKGEPDFLTEINQQLQSASDGLSFREQVEVARNDSISAYVNTYTGPSSIGISTEALAEAALADAVNSVQVFTKLFGPLDNDRLAVTQQSAWNFGQSWPSLVYLPYLPGLSSLLQLELGLDGYAGFVDQVGIHEIAHQWWGHHVGWASYRDQWLSEGFAEFSTALVIELTKGAKAYDEFWDQRRLSLLSKAPGAELAPYAAGALTLGYRAATERSPNAGRELIYSKGAYILQMLRTLMRDDKSRSDERFLAMLRDFADDWKGRNPSTEDFKAHLEKHMIPELNARGDGKMDWFFDQWVYGTEVPVYTADVQIEKAAKGKYRLVGTLSQSGVSDDFVALVPTYVDFGKGELGKFGRAPFKGNMTQKLDVTLELPKKPKAVVLNGRYEVLAFSG